MKWFKRSILAVLVVATVFGFTACSSNNKTAENVSQNASAAVNSQKEDGDAENNNESQEESAVITYETIENEIADEYKAYTQTITTPLEKLRTDIDGRYSGYEANITAVEEYYSMVIDTSNEFYFYLLSMMGEYYQLITATEDLDTYWDRYNITENPGKKCYKLIEKYLDDSYYEVVDDALKDIKDIQNDALKQSDGPVDHETISKAMNDVYEEYSKVYDLAADNYCLADETIHKAKDELYEKEFEEKTAAIRVIGEIFTKYKVELEKDLKKIS